MGEVELTEFLSLVSARLGADQLLTPREVTRGFLSVLDIMYQNPEQSVK
ncbi:MAG: BREX system ATP-binding domain-containing protein [Clostridiaceae bacterium]